MDVFLQTLSVGRRSFDDPFFEDGNKACGFFKRMCVFDIDEEELCHTISKEFCCEVPGCLSTFDTLIEFEIHYNTLHRYVCSTCHKTLLSPHFLDLHIEENHDSYFSLQAERKPMYQCLVEDCQMRFRTPGERKDHCLKTHAFPPNFRWFTSTRNPQKGKSRSVKPKPKKVVDTEMQEESFDSASTESVMETSTKNIEASIQRKQKKPRKKKTDECVKMDAESEYSGDSLGVEGGAKSDSSRMTTKAPVPFKGFIPRNVNANRTFFLKSHLKGQDWHQSASSSNAAPSSLEGSSLSADLRESLPTDMEES